MSVDRIPKVELVRSAENDEVDFEISDDSFAASALPARGVPVMVTLSKIGAQHFVADAAWDEEAAATSRLSVAVNAQGDTCGMQLTGAGGVSAAKLLDLIDVARVVGARVLRRLDRHLLRSDGGASSDGDTDEEADEMMQ